MPLTWIFDLDNTLHDASHAIFPAINANMNVYIANVLGGGSEPADLAAVNAVRVEYWQRYGATLLGMVKHHQVRAEDFLREAHSFDDLTSMIRTERGLKRLLRRLPGKKILLTNAPRRYSHDVLRHIGLHRHFAKHLPIESMHVHRRLRPKPSKALLRKILAKERLVARQSVLVEDSIENLKAAKALGMHTVWVTQYLRAKPQAQLATGALATLAATRHPAYVDVKVKSVRQINDHMHRLR
jgi:putative hydrolase of the HAD superfamily